MACLASRSPGFRGSDDVYQTIWPDYADAHCSANRYSLDWYLEAGESYLPPFAVAYGFSGDADVVEVAWGDGLVTRAKPLNGTYAAILDRRRETIKRIDFISGSGQVLHGFSPAMRIGIVVMNEARG